MNDRRRGLGRGLGALIPSQPESLTRPADMFLAPEPGDGDALVDSSPQAPAAAPPQLRPVPGAEFAHVPVQDIRANPRQPRQDFDEDELAELVQSIRAVGVLQPVVVRRVRDDPDAVPTDAAHPDAAHPDGCGYELIMGERRLRACIAAGQRRIPAIVRDAEDAELLRDALLENLHRSQLNPLEEAAAYHQLLQDFDCTHDVLAERLGRSRPQISNMVRLLKLPAPVQRRVASGVLSAGHARALLGMDDSAAMERLAARIVAEGLSVRSVEEIILLGEDREPTQRRRRSAAEPDPDLEQWSAQLSDALDTRVTIVMGKRKGRLSVDFASREDLERILALLGPDDPQRRRSA